MTRQTATIGAVLLLAGCGGGLGGGTNTISQQFCGPVRNDAWTTEVYAVSYARVFQYCPMVLKDSVQFTDESGWVDVLMSKHGGSVGFTGTMQLYTKGIAAGDMRQDSSQFPFSSNSPDVDTTGEDPERGLIPTFTWSNGRTPAAGKTETDSLDVQYPTNNEYTGNTFGGFYTAEGYARVPVVISTQQGAVTGPEGVLAGTAGNWRIVPDWDTSGYTFQWYVNGAAGSADTFATLNRTLSSTGVYALRNDQILADGTFLSSYDTVEAYNVSISGPTTVKPFASCEWSGSASGGTSPYSYDWDNGYYDGQYFDYANSSNDGESFTLTLKTTDSRGAPITISELVSVSNSAPICPDIRIGG